MDRRRFIWTGALALGGLAAAGCESDSAPAPGAGTAADTEAADGGVTMEQVGVQLYTLRDLLQEDTDGTLAQVAQAGYSNVETAGTYGHDAGAFREMLDRHGLAAPAGHYGLDTLRGENRARTIETARTLGHTYVVTPWIDEAERMSLDDYRRVAAEFNEIGRAVQEAGMQYAYHNHDFEFETMDGGVGYDVLLAETDPDVVDMELDLFWIVEGGYDPLAYFEQHPGRFPLWHVKDRTTDGEMVNVGAGAIDFAEIFAHAEQSGLEFAIVEHDRPEDPLASIRTSYDHVAELVG